jgi:predicted kinase
MPKLILVRGIPGAGKSTYAKKLHDDGDVFIHLETDNYWIRPDGHYDFNVHRIKESHAWCLKNTKEWMVRLPYQSIAVANTFTQKWEMQKYIDLAKELDYDLEVHRLNGGFESIHSVPKETIDKMIKRFEDYEGEILVND